MGKITVKHYLNKSTKGGTSVEVGHPIYVQVTAKRQVNRMRSQAEKFYGVSWIELKLKQQEFENILQGNYSDIISGERIRKALELEARIIKEIIAYLRPFDRDNFSISSFADIYNIATEDIAVTIDNMAKSLLYQALYDQWFEFHYIINWERSFVEIMNGLGTIGSNNNLYQLLILNNETIKLLKTAVENIYLFLNTYYENEDEPFNWFAFYWFKNDITNEYIDYLLKQDIIQKNHITVLQACFDNFGEQTLTTIKASSNGS